MTRNKDPLLRLVSYKSRTQLILKLEILTSRTDPRSILLCRKCLSSQRHSSSTSAAAAEAVTDAPEPLSTDVTPASADSHSLPFKISAAVLLSRPPLLTRDLTPFEKAFFLYQRRLNERSALPFSRYFYYAKNTPGEVEWKRKIKQRLTPSREIGRYSGYGSEAWNDEVLVGSALGEPEVQKYALLEDSAVEVKRRNEKGEEEIIREDVEKSVPRRTEADEKGDRRSLNRALTRTLYLLLKRKTENQGSEWVFPVAELMHDEALHYVSFSSCPGMFRSSLINRNSQAAERVITQSAGNGMNTWVVGKVPIGHATFNYPQPIINKEQGSQRLGEKTFFMKARIMAGKPILDGNKYGILDYQWLAKEEMKEVLGPFLWSAVKNSIADR